MFKYASTKEKIGLVCVFTIFFVAVAFPVDAASKGKRVRQGNKLFKKEYYKGAIKKYSEALAKDPESAIIHYNLGSAYYKDEQYGKAVEHLNKALLTEDEKLQAKAAYNLGNAYLKMGEIQADTNLNLAYTATKEALKQFEKAVSLDENDEDAKYNKEYTEKRLEKIEKFLEKQKQQGGGQGEGHGENGDSKNGQKSHDPNAPQDDNLHQESDDADDTFEDDNAENSSSQNRTPAIKDPEQNENQQKNSQNSQNSDENQAGQQGEQGSPDADEGDSGVDGAQNESDRTHYNEGDEDTEDKLLQDRAGGASMMDASQLTEEEAQMLLDNYQQSEAPNGLLLFNKRKANDKPVLKDW